MAYASLVVVSKVIDQILPNDHHYSSICTKHQITSLRQKVVRFQEYFEYISGRPVTPHYSSEVDQLESRIRDVAYKMEDMLEYILIWSFSQQHEDRVEGVDAEADEVDLQSTSLPTVAEFSSCLEEVDLLLGETMEMRNKIIDKKLVTCGTFTYSHNIAATSSSSSSGPPNVGLDGDLTKILGRITGRPSTFQVVPITGMGGIGKTTLARAVYDYHRKQGHFDLVLWATVSQQYDVKEILRVLCPENVGSDKILNVHQRLKGRRYLIILDDIWDEKVWDGVRIAFPDDNNYSRVILTTRLSKVATYVSSSITHAHQMQLLNEEQSWDLLQEKVYGHGAGRPGEFEDMGRTISGSCKGLPLALVVIGGLLKVNKTRNYWIEVAESTTAIVAGNDALLRIMSLSYKNLPPHLKACFLYMASFSEDEEIPTKELVRLWCAEGFLKPRESKTMEEVAEECLEELVDRNLILVKKKRYNGKIKTSSIHDVLRDLSLKQAQNEKFLYFHDGRSEIDGDTSLRIIKDQQRRVSFPRLILDSSISFYPPLRTFRTESSMDYDQLSTIIPHFRLLRVLGKVKSSSSSFVKYSFRLNNLRYLKSSGYEPLMVPESISKLRNLETLIVSGKYPSNGKYQLFLPVETWEMPRLRHLISEVKMKLPPFPASDQDEDSSIESSSLQTPSGVVNLDFTPSVIQKLQNLKTLQIKYMDMSSRDDKVFDLNNLVNLHHLEDLTISRDNNGPRVRNIGFPCKLKQLRLSGTCLPWEKMTLIGDLIHLEVLKLNDWSFYGEVWEPIEGGFPQLKYLKMKDLWYWEEWRAESTHFPSLEKLVILNCKKLKEVPAEIGEIDTLEKLIVKRADFYSIDQSVGDGFEESVRRIEDESVRAGNDSLQVYILSKDQELRDVDS